MFFGPLRESVGHRTVRYETDVETAGELLTELQESFPDLRELVEDGDVADGIAITHNDKHLRHRDGLDTSLEDGDVLRLTTVIYGG